MDPRPTVGRVVLYTLSDQDAQRVAEARHASPATRTGNRAEAGQVYPMVIVRAWGDQPHSAVNGQVLLDGDDTLWVTSVTAGEGPRHFAWPQRV